MGAQKTVEGENAKGEEMAGIQLALVVKDIIHHEKNKTRSVSLFANLGPSGGERLGTVNLNINNLTKEGMAYLEKALGSKLTLKTPIMSGLFIPQGSLLDHWMEARPTPAEEKTTPDESGSEV
jgi:hypothetical protein